MPLQPPIRIAAERAVRVHAGTPDTKAIGSKKGRPSRRPYRHTETSLGPKIPAQQLRSTSNARSKYPGIILQPDSSPISEEQLAIEIKGIYDGLVTIETKCIDIDAALAHDSKSQMGVEQWQALIALHRTLLYEHHDFLMASQHPSATASEELKALQTMYSMPARMWKHGIHAFLEVLRHRRPESQEHMLAFVVLAYQMMALLFDTMPCFTNTWIECLGDLAGYRMAIEDDREMHAVWGSIAARWQTLDFNRHSDVGRLYHYLCILERPSMRKLASYTKSLTCSIQFTNVRDSIETFLRHIVQADHLPEFGNDQERIKVLKAGDTRYPSSKKTNVNGPQSSIRVDSCRSQYSGKGSKEPIWYGETPGLRQCDKDGRRVRKDVNVALSWAVLCVAGGSINHAAGNTSGGQQKGAAAPITQPWTDVRTSWCWIGANVVRNARQAILRPIECLATLSLTGMHMYTRWPLLFVCCPKTVMGHPIADSTTATQVLHNSNFPHWIWPSILVFLALARATWNALSLCKSSAYWTNLEIVSAGVFLFAGAMPDFHQTVIWTIFASWLVCALGNVIVRYRLAARRFRRRNFPLMVSAGAIVAFAAAAMFAKLTETGSIVRQALFALPLGLSVSTWALSSLLQSPEQVRPHSGDETSDTEAQSRCNQALPPGGRPAMIEATAALPHSQDDRAPGILPSPATSSSQFYSRPRSRTM